MSTYHPEPTEQDIQAQAPHCASRCLVQNELSCMYEAAILRSKTLLGLENQQSGSDDSQAYFTRYPAALFDKYAAALSELRA